MADKILGFLGDLVEPASGGGVNYVYFDTSSITEPGREVLDVLYSVSCILKENTEEDGVGIFNTGYRYEQFPPLAIGIDLNMRISKFDEEGHLTNEFTTMKEMLVDDGISWILDLPRITEEEFYKIPTQFTVQYLGMDVPDSILEYEEGMTWEEWCSSSYNLHGFYIDDNGYMRAKVPELGYDGNFVELSDYSSQLATALVKSTTYAVMVM